VRNSYFPATCLATLFTGMALAQSAPPLTLTDCIRLATSVPSAISIAKQDREIAARETTRARAGMLPQSRFGTGFTYNSPLLYNRELFSFLPLNGIREYSGTFSVSQELDTSGRLRADVARARAGQDAAAVGVALTERDLKRAVTGAYFRLALTRRLIEIGKDAVAESESFEKRTKLLFEGGEAARADLVKASAQLAFLRQALSAAELESQLANQDLASFWTREVTDRITIADTLDEAPPVPELTTAAAAPFLKRLEFDLLESQRKSFQADLRRARADLLPQLSVVFQYGIDSTAVRIRDRGYATFVNLNIPIFDWMKARSGMRQFQLRTEQVQANRAISERTFSRDYQNALARVKQIYEQIDLTRQQTKLAEEDLRLSRVRYEGGEGSALDVVTAQTQLAQARTNLYTTMANYLNARADLEVTAGR
jgi:outer membrane protein TolC